MKISNEIVLDVLMTYQGSTNPYPSKFSQINYWVAGVGLVMHEPSRLAICERYARTGRVLNDSVERHALVLEGAEVLMNPVGLAPGEDIHLNGQRIFLLPGPPHEFEAILSELVVPRLARLAPEAPPEMRMFQVCGIGESDLISRLGGDAFPGPGLEVAYCASIGRVEVRLWSPRDNKAQLDQVAARFRAVAGPHLYAERPIALEEDWRARWSDPWLRVPEALAAGAVATLPDAAESVPYRDASAVFAAGQVPRFHGGNGGP